MTLMKENPENYGKHAYGLVWSGDFMPMVGDIVGTASWGNGIVKGYFTEDGFLGVELTPINLPKWWIEQMKAGGHPTDTIHLFGVEIKKGKQ